MIEVIEEAEDEVVVVKVSGIVTRKNMEAAVPQLERIMEERAPLRLYVDLVGLDRFEPSGLWEELKFQFRHRDEIARAAFVVNSPGEQWARWLGELLVSGVAREFQVGEEPQARAWLRRA